MRLFFRILFNKFLLVTAAFIVWMTFFDANDYYSQQGRLKELSEVTTDIARLNTEISQMEGDYRALMTDPKAFEQYAREHYRMKRDTEDLYVIERPKH